MNLYYYYINFFVKKNLSNDSHKGPMPWAKTKKFVEPNGTTHTEADNIHQGLMARNMDVGAIGFGHGPINNVPYWIFLYAVSLGWSPVGTLKVVEKRRTLTSELERWPRPTR